MILLDHPDAKALYENVLDHPDDDVLRLICADWLEEHQEVTWAELIRTQIQLAKMSDCTCQFVEDVCESIVVACDKCQFIDELLPCSAKNLPIDFNHARANKYPIRSNSVMRWERGFPSEVRCSMPLLVKWKDLLSHLPLRWIDITDRKITRTEEGWGWTYRTISEFQSAVEPLPLHAIPTEISTFGIKKPSTPVPAEYDFLISLSEPCLRYIHSLRFES